MKMRSSLGIFLFFYSTNAIVLEEVSKQSDLGVIINIPVRLYRLRIAFTAPAGYENFRFANQAELPSRSVLLVI